MTSKTSAAARNPVPCHFETALSSMLRLCRRYSELYVHTHTAVEAHRQYVCDNQLADGAKVSDFTWPSQCDGIAEELGDSSDDSSEAEEISCECSGAGERVTASKSPLTCSLRRGSRVRVHRNLRLLLHELSRHCRRRIDREGRQRGCISKAAAGGMWHCMQL